MGCKLGLLLIIWFAFSCIPIAVSYNFLIVYPFGTISHKHVLDAIAEELVNSGHHVTLYSRFLDTKNVTGVTQVYLPKVATAMAEAQFNFFMGSMLDLSTLKALRKMLGNVREATYDSPEIQQLLSNGSSSKHYDLIVVDAIFNEFMLPIGHRLDIPTVYISPGIIYTPIYWNLNIPYPYAYLSHGLDGVVGPMTFGQRFTNVIANLALYVLRHWWLFEDHDAFIQSVLPGTPPLIELERNVSFVMAHTLAGVHNNAPSMPYMEEIACCHCRLGRKLPKYFEDFLEGSGDHGAIYFSLGSLTRGDMMPPEVLQKLMTVFAQLPQKVLFKYETELFDVTSNVELIKWAPQQDLLAHPKLRLFITHGGGQSLLESVHHACPVLVIPLSADQLGFASQAKNHGFGEFIEWRAFTEEELLEKITNLLTDPRYKRSAEIISRRLKDQLVPPTKKVVFWLEYVIKHKGAHHLKSKAEGLSVWQYFLLDVVATIILMVITVVAVLFYLLKTALALVTRILNQRHVKQKLN